MNIGGGFMNRKNIAIVLFFLHQTNYAARNIHRHQDASASEITISFDTDSKLYDSKSYTIKDSHLRELPLFKTYNHEYLKTKTLPNKITFMNEPDKTVDRQTIEKIINNLLYEIKTKKKTFTDFTVLKKRDFNFFQNCGLIVLKFKDYPFVFKLFMETPESFSKPYAKSFQVRGIFILGGTFRHIMGHTRIRNLELIEQKIKGTEWEKKIKFPRKFFWTPEENSQLLIKGRNLGELPAQEIRMPSIYGVICDEIKENDSKNPLFQREFLRFCSFLDFTLDPNPNNFKVDKDNNFVLIDTEHFWTLVGLRTKMKSYDKFVCYLPKIAGKYIKDRWLTLKSERVARQRESKTLFPLFD